MKRLEFTQAHDGTPVTLKLKQIDIFEGVEPNDNGIKCYIAHIDKAGNTRAWKVRESYEDVKRMIAAAELGPSSIGGFVVGKTYVNEGFNYVLVGYTFDTSSANSAITLSFQVGDTPPIHTLSLEDAQQAFLAK